MVRGPGEGVRFVLVVYLPQQQPLAPVSDGDPCRDRLLAPSRCCFGPASLEEAPHSERLQLELHQASHLGEDVDYLPVFMTK